MPSGIGGKRSQQLRAARAAKKRQTDDGYELPESVLRYLDVEDFGENENLEVPVRFKLQGLNPSSSHWEDLQLDDEQEYTEDSSDDGLENDDEVEVTDSEEEDDNVTFDGCAFEAIIKGSYKFEVFEEAEFPYQRGPELSMRSKQMKNKAAQELARSAEGSKKIYQYFQLSSSTTSLNSMIQSPAISREDLLRREREAAIKSLEKKLQGKQRNTMNGQTIIRHEAVLAFLRIQQGKQLGETRESMAQIVARCFGKGVYFARKVVSWEIEWIGNRSISEGRRGCFVKT